MSYRPWPFNGYVINNSRRAVRVWSDDRGVYEIPAGSTSNRYVDDVDHIEDIYGQWWKIGPNTATVDASGNVSGAQCQTSTYGVDCEQ